MQQVPSLSRKPHAVDSRSLRLVMGVAALLLCMPLSASGVGGGGEAPAPPVVGPDVAPDPLVAEQIAFTMALGAFLGSSQDNQALFDARTQTLVAALAAGAVMAPGPQNSPQAAAAYAAHQAAVAAFRTAFLAYLVAMPAPLGDPETLAELVAMYA